MLLKIKFQIVVIFFAISIITLNLYSFPNGIAGRTLKTTTAGCSTCHGYSNSVTGVFVSPDTVIAGQTYTFTLTLTSLSGTGKYGVDISSKFGVLSAISGQGLMLLSDELVHSAGINYVSPKIISFSYTAPNTAGVDTLYATIARGYTGAWNLVPNKQIYVKLPTGIINTETPAKFYISQNFPNPFNPVTAIKFGAAKSSNIKISVYDLLGKEVVILINDYVPPGNYFISFDASKLSSGIYYYKILSADFTDVKKMILVK